MSRSNRFIQEQFPENRGQNITEPRKRQHKAQVSPTQEGHASEEPKNKESHTKSHEWIKHGSQVAERVQRNHFRDMLHAPSKRKIAERVEENNSQH